jgi:hypothetical protein
MEEFRNCYSVLEYVLVVGRSAFMNRGTYMSFILRFSVCSNSDTQTFEKAFTHQDGNISLFPTY